MLQIKRSALALILILSLMASAFSGCSTVRTQNNDDEDEDKSTKRSGRQIISKEKVDIPDADYTIRIECIKDKKLPLQADAEYNTIAIYKDNGDDDELVYSYDDRVSDENEEMITGYEAVEGFDDLRGAVIIKIQENEFGMTSILLVGEANGDYQELFYDQCYDGYLLEDIDQNGSTELLVGASNGGGYVSWWAGFHIAHELKGDTFKSSYELTRDYYSHMAVRAEKTFLNDETTENLKAYTEACVFRGDEERVAELISDYPELMADLDKSLTDEVPADTYADFVSYQASSYKLYWDELFTGDPSYEKDNKLNQGSIDVANDPFTKYVRSTGDSNDIILNERSDIDLDGNEEAVIATGDEEFTSAVYVLREKGGKIVRLGENPAEFSGYGLYEPKLIKLQGMPQTYIYCGLTNGGNLYGFEILELSGDDLVQIVYSASPTGAGDDILTDSDGDGEYDGFVQYRSSYDVLYLSTAVFYEWRNGDFIPISTKVDVGDYPSTVKDVVLQYLSLRMIDNGLSEEVTDRLKELCTLTEDQVPLQSEIWFNAVMGAFMGFEETQLTAETKGNEATAVMTYVDETEKEYSLTFHLTLKNNKWVIDKIS